MCACAWARARLTQFDGYTPVFTGIHYGYDTRMIPTEDTTDPLRPLTTLGTRRFEFFLISHKYNMEEIAGSNAHRERKTPRGPVPNERTTDRVRACFDMYARYVLKTTHGSKRNECTYNT